MGILLQDLRFALRQLRKAPSFAVTAVLTLALGVGANTAIFSIVNSLVLKPLPVANPQQIATLALGQNHGPMLPMFSWPEYKEIRAQSRHSFSDVAVNSGLDGFAMQGQQPQRIMTAYVSGNFFETFGLQPAAGRLFLRSEGETFGSDPVLVLSYDFWKEKFNTDPNVVGRQATVDGHPFSIIGVAPKGFHGVQTFVMPAAYLPVSQLPIEGATADALNIWQSRPFSVYGRLRPGVSLKQATAELNVIAQAITRQQPDAEKNLTLAAFPEPAMRVSTGDPNTMYVIAALFLSLAGMVLLLACVNVGQSGAGARHRPRARDGHPDRPGSPAFPPHRADDHREHHTAH